MQVSRPEPTTAAEVMARAREVAERRRRVLKPLDPKSAVRVAPPQQVEKPIVKASADQPVEKPTRVVMIMPTWMVSATEFDEHVKSYRDFQAKLENARISGIDVDAVLSRRPIDQIVRMCVAKYPDVTMSDVLGPLRDKAIVFVRQLAMWEIHQQRKDVSIARIAKFFGRDHTTALHAIRKIEALNGNDEAAEWMKQKYADMSRREKERRLNEQGGKAQAEEGVGRNNKNSRRSR